jgi:hypothetical protein
VAVPSGPPLKMAATTLRGTCGRGRRLNEQPLGGRPQANPGNVRRLRAVTGSKVPPERLSRKRAILRVHLALVP